MTVDANELERLVERLSAELARQSSRPARVKPRDGRTAGIVTLVAAAIGIACCSVTFVLSRAPLPAHAAPVGVATINDAPIEPIVIKPAPTLAITPAAPAPPARPPPDRSYLREL